MHVLQCMQHRPRCTEIYSVRKLSNARVRNFYAYENFFDYSIDTFWSMDGPNLRKLVCPKQEKLQFTKITVNEEIFVWNLIS